MPETAPRKEGPGIEGPARRSVAVIRARDAEAAGAVLGRAFGIDWPVAPSTIVDDGTMLVAWTAPGEWTVIGAEPAEVASRATAALGEATHHVADVSDGTIFFAIEGPEARDLLAKECPLDLHPRAVPPPWCAQTIFARVPVLIHHPGGDRFTLAADAALSDYLTAWFAAAAEEFSAVTGPSP